MSDAVPALRTPTDLAANEVWTLDHALNRVLADCFALYLKTKNYHWHISGPHFRDYHLMLDEQAAELFALTAVIAERMRKTGNTTLRSIGDVARFQEIRDDDRDFVAPLDMLTELRDDNLHLVERFRAIKAKADEARDNATSGMVDAWTDEAERRAWFLFETTRRS